MLGLTRDLLYAVVHDETLQLDADRNLLHDVDCAVQCPVSPRLQMLAARLFSRPQAPLPSQHCSAGCICTRDMDQQWEVYSRPVVISLDEMVQGDTCILSPSRPMLLFYSFASCLGHTFFRA